MDWRFNSKEESMQAGRLAAYIVQLKRLRASVENSAAPRVRASFSPLVLSHPTSPPFPQLSPP